MRICTYLLLCLSFLCFLSLARAEEDATQSAQCVIPYVVGSPVIGYLSLDPETSLIAGLYVSTPGQGAGKSLIDHVKADRDFLQLWTHAQNEAAHRFYEREEFVRSGETRDGDDGLVELHMEWRA